uniref:Uncharacterized protein n=1 Tax=Gibberella zeae TaxID=5518 RepID=A0A4E9E745_GIBZA
MQDRYLPDMVGSKVNPAACSVASALCGSATSQTMIGGFRAYCLLHNNLANVVDVTSSPFYVLEPGVCMMGLDCLKKADG